MSKNISNLKLELFFDHMVLKNKKNKKASKEGLKKEASVGHFNDTITEEDAAKNAKMISEMLALPKYQEIKNKLTHASGIVNLVTAGEYSPLVELLIKKCFPPNNNDIYNMNMPTLSDDYFIDATNFFGGISGGTQGNPPDQESARYRLSEMLMGSRTKMSSKWAEEMGMKLEDIEQYIGNQQEQQNIANQYGSDGDEQSTLSDEIKAYEENVKRLDRLGTEVKNLHRTIVNNDTAAKPLAPQKIKELKLKFKRLRALYGSLKKNVDDAGKAYVIPDAFAGEAERNSDGFIQYDPLEAIKGVTQELLASWKRNAEPPVIARNIYNLKEKLLEYKTTDPVLLRKRQQWVDFLGEADEVSVNNFIESNGLFLKLVNEFAERASNHGKVMIFKNFENSVLCVPPSGTDNNRYILKDGGVLSDFAAANAANLTRDRSGRSSKGGKRVMVVLSNAPISGLPANSVVDLSRYPVDTEEAEIIIRNLLSQYETKSKKTATLKLFSDIDEKYDKLFAENPDNKRALETQKRTEKQSVPSILERMENLGSVTRDVEFQMARMLVGMGQKDAVNAAVNALSGSTIYEEDERGRLVSYGVDALTVVPNLTQNVNDIKGENSKGLGVRAPKVEFQDYVYKKVSSWGAKVGDVGVIAREVSRLKEVIKRSYDAIREIDSQLLASDLSPETKRQLEKSKEGWYSQIHQAQGDRVNYMAKLPHFTILYGKPGVGKSVWADALGSLFGYVINNINIGETKNKWLGTTEERTRQLLQTIFESKDMIFLLDEVDRQLTMGHGSGGSGSGDEGHATERSTVNELLSAFEDRKTELIENNTFVIMTTNHLNSVDTALLSRTEGNAFEVEAAETKEDFLKFLNSFIHTEYKKDPSHPWFYKPGDKTIEDQWNSTFEFLASLNMEAIAEALEGKGLGFRDVEGMFKQAFANHTAYLINMEAIGRGETTELHGLPLTTENILGAIKYAKDASASNADYRLGIDDVKSEKIKQAQQIMDNAEMVQTDATNPFTGEKYKTYEMPEEVLKVMNGSVPTAEQVPQFSVLEEPVEDAETGRIRYQPVIQENQPKSMEELVGEGFEEQELEPEKTPKGKKPEKEKEEEKEEGITSNTDYLYNYLKTSGYLDESGKLKIKEAQAGNQPQQKETVNEGFNYKEYNSIGNLESRGVFYFGGTGGGFIAPNI